MLITSMGIFGFLSKAHSDQSLVSGDVQSKIAIYDEKIKTAKENIEANRKQLKQMDEAVDQVMGRSTDEKGADKANNIRKSQQRDRSALAKDIEANQKLIATLNDEAAPIRAEIRKVEAEVGPIKYIAKFIYGDAGADENMLEKAVTWIIIMIVIVFDPLAVIMLLAAQMTFGWQREQKKAEGDSLTTESKNNIVDEPTVTTVPESWPFPTYEEITPKPIKFVDAGEHPADNFEHELEKIHTETDVPSETPLTALGGDITAPEEPVVPGTTESELDKWNKMIAEAEAELAKEPAIVEPVVQEEPEAQEESKKKTYMTKDETGHIQIKTRN
jgi:hypothetical protein